MSRSGSRNGMCVTEKGTGRRGTAICGLALAAATSACSGSGGSSSPDTPPEISIITIQTFPGGPPYGIHPENIPLLAFQDGDGPWRQLQGANGTYFAPITGQRYAVATICREALESISTSLVALQYLSVSDTTHVQATGCLELRPTVHVSAQLQGVPSDQLGEVFFGSSLATQQTPGSPFEAFLVQGAPVDVLISALDGSNVPRKVYRGPALDALADQTLQYDLSVLGAPLDSQPLTVTGTNPTELVEVRSFLHTRSSEAPWFVDDRTFSTTPPDHYSSVPVAAGRQLGDITLVTINAMSTQVSGDDRAYWRSAAMEMQAPTPITMALPAPWSIESPTLENTAPHRAMMTLPAAPAAQGAVDYYAQFFTSADDSITWNLTIGAGWLEGRGAVTVTTADLSGLVKVPATITLPLDRNVYWTISRVERNADFDAPATDGKRVLGNQISGTIHPSAPSRAKLGAITKDRTVLREALQSAQSLKQAGHLAGDRGMLEAIIAQSSTRYRSD